jgi:membrane protein YdbS with pleckstrin-like domain
VKSKKLNLATEKEKRHYSDYLADGEEIIAVFGIGRTYYLINFISLLILSFVVIGIPFLLRLMHLKHALTYILTDRRVLLKDGIFSVKTTSVPYDKITHIKVKQTFLNRISYDMGDITIHTAGPTPVEIDLIKVQSPMKVKNLIEELIIKERSLLGVVSGEKRNSFVHPL